MPHLPASLSLAGTVSNNAGVMPLRTILVWAVGSPITLVLFICVLLASLVDRSGNLVHSISAFWFRIILALSGVRVEVTGVENVPADRPVIFISNHQGAFDIPVLQACLPVQFRWVAKRSLFSIPVVGWTMRLARYIAIDRENPQKAAQSMEAAAEKIKGGTSVIVFPEGTRSDTGELLPFKRGSFLLAARSGVDIVPVALNGTNVIMKRGSLKIAPARVTLRIGEPMPTRGVRTRELMNTTREAVSGLLAGGKVIDGG